MTDTTVTVTSDAKLCDCGAAFGKDDDKRFAACAACRGKVADPVETVATESTSVQKDDALGPIRLDVAKYEPPPVVDRSFYWCGATDDSPSRQLTLGGISFPHMIGEIRKTPGGKQEFFDGVHRGEINRLTDAQVVLIKEHAANKVVRHYHQSVYDDGVGGEKSVTYHGRIFSRTGQKSFPFDPQPDDIPLGCFVYMVRVSSRTDRPMDSMKPMVQRE